MVDSTASGHLTSRRRGWTASLLWSATTILCRSGTLPGQWRNPGTRTIRLFQCHLLRWCDKRGGLLLARSLLPRRRTLQVHPGLLTVERLRGWFLVELGRGAYCNPFLMHSTNPSKHQILPCRENRALAQILGAYSLLRLAYDVLQALYDSALDENVVHST